MTWIGMFDSKTKGNGELVSQETNTKNDFFKVIQDDTRLFEKKQK